MKKLILHNIRYGFATNSSSSHSIIYRPNSFTPGKIKKSLTKGGPGEQQYGWDNFVLDSYSEKMNYFAQMFKCSTNMNFEVQNAISEKLLGVTLDEEGYIDHQSVLAFPVDRKTGIIDSEFLKEFAQFVASDDVMITGGNDNDDHRARDNYPDWNEHPMVNVSGRNVWARKDPKYGCWTLFYPDTGTKVRMSFKEPNQEIVRLSHPELVDMKITDYCPYGCTFCYQGSTLKGQHADYADVVHMIRDMADVGVFEIAFGGGEPSLHPEFDKILKFCKENNIIANFTTKNRNVFLMLPKYENLGVGGIAYSVTTPNDVQILLGELAKSGYDMSDYSKRPGVEIVLHVVLGTVTEKDFVEIVTLADQNNLPITLLGYKYTGRGNDFEQIHMSKPWYKILMDLRENKIYPTIAIDTVVAAQYQKELEENGIPSWMYHTKEGAFSAYVDAVKLQFGKSSFEDENNMIAIHRVSSYYGGEKLEINWEQFSTWPIS